MTKRILQHRVSPQQTAAVKRPSNFVGSDWLDSDNVKDLAYGLRVNAQLAMLASKGLRAYEADFGTPADDVYELIDSLVHTVSVGALVLARKLDALPEEDA